MQKQYCLINADGIKMKPICNNNVRITQKEYDDGYRITPSTIGFSSYLDTAREVYIINEYDIGEYTIALGFKGIIKISTLTSANFSKLSLSVNLQNILVVNNHTIVPINNEKEIKQKINSIITPLKRDIKFMDIDVLRMLGVDPISCLSEIVGEPVNINGLKLSMNFIRD